MTEIFRFTQILQLPSHCRVFLSSLIFVGKARSLPIMKGNVRTNTILALDRNILAYFFTVTAALDAPLW